jgi:hypothetical protein
VRDASPARSPQAMNYFTQLLHFRHTHVTSGRQVAFREAASALRIIRVETPSGTSRSVRNHESACFQRKRTRRSGNVPRSISQGRVEAKNPARDRRTAGRTSTAGHRNDGTHEKVDHGGLTSLGAEEWYPRIVDFRCPRETDPGTSFDVLNAGAFTVVVRK